MIDYCLYSHKCLATLGLELIELSGHRMSRWSSLCPFQGVGYAQGCHARAVVKTKITSRMRKQPSARTGGGWTF